MLANAQAKLVHDFESPSLQGRTRGCYQNTRNTQWRPLCPERGAQQLTSFFSSKYILVTKKGICRNDKFDSFFFLGEQQRDFDGDNIIK